ncbi:MAG: tetratricopeptide repeat protein [Bacteroidales bacterium]|nr:tetratricopeptide repeat protein [Bacteroidales bacterium]
MTTENLENVQQEPQNQQKSDQKKGPQFSWHNIDEFFKKNNKIISIVVGTLVVIVVGFWGYKKFIQGPREEKAGEEMYFAEYYFTVDSLNKALNGDGIHPGFLDIINDYSGTSVGNLARFYAGVIYLKQGLYDEAIEQLKKFKKRGYIIGAIGYGLLGDAYVELGDYENAIKYYKKASEHYPNFFTTPMYLLRLGWCYEETGEWEKSLECYKQIQENYPNSFEARDIKRYIGRAEHMLSFNQP